MPIKEVEVDWFTKTLPLNQIYQPTQMQFSFLSSPKDGNKQCHPFVLCRDYLHDAVRCSYNKNSCDIYGFTFAYDKNPPLDLNYTRMLVTMKDMPTDGVETFGNKMKLALKILHNYEDLAGWRKSRLYKVKSNNSKVWLFVSTNMWMKSPSLVSMYSFLIRLGDKYTELKDFTDNEDLKSKLSKLAGKPNDNTIHPDNDISYLKNTWNKLDKVIECRDELLFGKGKPDILYKDNLGINPFHNNTGILSLCRAGTPSPERNALATKLLIQNNTTVSTSQS